MRLALGLMAIALSGCAEDPAQAPLLPPGWTLGEVEACCSVGVPPGARIEEVAGEIDDPATILSGPSFDALFSVTAMATGLPHPTSGTGYSTSERMIDGLPAQIAAYEVAGDPLPQKRFLVWTFAGDNDGTGRSLLISFACREAGCDLFEPLVRSLGRRTTAGRR